jgi:hypothetical protein
MANASTTTDTTSFEQAIIAIVRTLPTERTQQVLEFARELQSESALG